MRFLLEDKSLVCNQTLAVVEDKYLGRKGLKYVSSVQWEEEDECDDNQTKWWQQDSTQYSRSRPSLSAASIKLPHSPPTWILSGFKWSEDLKIKVTEIIVIFHFWCLRGGNQMVGMGMSQSYCTGNWFGYLSNPLIFCHILQDLNSIMTIRESVVNILYWDCKGKLSDNCYQWWPSRSQHLPTSLLSSSTLSSFSSQYST